MHVLQARSIAGSDVVIVFNKGQSSRGGAIDLSTGAIPLRTDVEPISYTDNGPVW